MNEKNTHALQRRVYGLLTDVDCDPYRFDVVERDGEICIEARLWRQDADTGEWGWGRGGLYLIDELWTDDVIVKRFFLAAKSYSEHEVREAFLWKGRRIFGPHLSLERLWEAAADEVLV